VSTPNKDFSLKNEKGKALQQKEDTLITPNQPQPSEAQTEPREMQIFSMQPFDDELFDFAPKVERIDPKGSFAVEPANILTSQGQMELDFNLTQTSPASAVKDSTPDNPEKSGQQTS
jgi:hypothetical protein